MTSKHRLLQIAAFFPAFLAPVPSVGAAETQIVGAFSGCDFDKTYELANGRLLVCKGYSYSYIYNPTVIAIDGSSVLIGEERYEAIVTDGRVFKTNVSGTFEGCNYGAYVSFDNGLVLACQTYHYHYAYRPEVRIIALGSNYTVYIDNEKYDGVLYRK